MELIDIFTSAVDILVVAFFIYLLLKWFAGSRAVQLLAGIISLFGMFVLSKFFHLYTIEWVLQKMLPVVVIVLVVVFQPELRRALERIGRQMWLVRMIFLNSRDRHFGFFNKVINAVEYLSKNKIGAIIAIERVDGLADFIESGLRLDALISEDLLIAIFQKGSPLHDGAVVIRGDQIVAARVIFPLTKSTFIDQRLGTRHKAAIGLSEIADSLIIVVSEGTGIISMAEEGTLIRYMSRDNLEERLLSLYQKEKRRISIINFLKRDKDK